MKKLDYRDMTRQFLQDCLKEEKAKLHESVPGPDAGSVNAAREALNRALAILERMGYEETADHVIAALKSLDYPAGTY